MFQQGEVPGEGNIPTIDEVVVVAAEGLFPNSPAAVIMPGVAVTANVAMGSGHVWGKIVLVAFGCETS